jgi:hypothetical protein
MGLFGKKDKKEEVKRGISNIPELPELPKLPELPSMNEFSYEEDSLPQLPKFPNNPLGDKFSQNTIKEAITGKREDEEVFDAEDFPDEEEGMMQKPLQKPLREDFENYETGISTRPSIKPKSMEVAQNFITKNYITKKAEPIFIRIDKFEESMKIFQDIRSQVSEIESLIKNIKEIKSKEEEELTSWETEIQQIKDQIEKVNQDIFSRIE